jgi:putative heme-binding domain-containing protein
MKLGMYRFAASFGFGITAILAASGYGQDATTKIEPYAPHIAENVKVPEGFQVEKIFQVPKGLGSWVSLTTDAKGRLIASDQGGAGLFTITPGDAKQPTKVERIPVNISGAQGLLWAFDSLYVVVNGGRESGLHRLRDTDGDGVVDKDEFCMHVDGSGEHGPHAVILSPDGQSLFVASGNHTKLPAFQGSRIPSNWNEDHLLPRRWDANGHAAGILAPGGWICKVDPSGKNWEVFSIGYRNEYDIAFNPDGELFTYDSDMEWDFGSPWYRPTRVCHATSGSEFGWRSGTGKWPIHYEDSLPPALDIGPGSPTGVVFGTGAKFPAKYQKAMYILDWTYSTIYAVDLTPEGSSYRGTKSDFVTGTPVPVTDAVVGFDGALYFATGGRGTESSVFRVTYVGKESTELVSGKDTAGAELRALRHQLESYHGRKDVSVDLILPYLMHEDRFIRYAARVALESQPIGQWKSKLNPIQAPKGVINAAMALAHQGAKGDLPQVIGLLSKLNFSDLTPSDGLAWLRAWEIAFARLGEPEESQRQKLVSVFDALYPSKTYEANAELVQLLVYLKSPSVVAKTLALMNQLGPEPIPDWGYLVSRNAGYGGTVGKMLADMPPVRAIHFAFVLRNAKSGWTIEERKQYFEFFIKAAKHPGGNSFAKFLMQFRDDAIATCTPAEQILLAPITGVSLLSAPVESTPPQGPGRKWTTDEALKLVESELTGRNYKSGRNLFHATSCSKCHRLGGEGGAIGPDLSTAAKKFSMRDMLDAIVEPSKAISDQYGSQQVITEDGRALIGRTVEIGDEYYVYLADAEAKPVVLKKSEVQELKPSKVSQMPAGLIDTLNENELKDLLAYLMSSGDPNSKMFRNRK